MSKKRKIITISLAVLILIIILTIILLVTNSELLENISNNGEATVVLGDNIKIEGKGVENKNGKIIITAGGEYTIKGTLENGMIEVDTEGNVILNLDNVNLKNDSGPAIFIINANETTLVLSGENYLEDGSEYSVDAKATLFSNDTLKIEGEGTLEIVGNYKHAIASDDNIVISDGNIILSATKDGIHANDEIQIDNGTILVKTANDAIESEGTIVINDGEFDINCNDDGITASGDFTINGGTFNITKCEEGIESKELLTINDGLIEIEANDDGLNSTNMQINGGKIYCNAKNGDAIDANGNIEITGGIIVAIGGNVPEGGLDFDNNICKVTGGTIIATGGVNSTPTESECTQNVILLGDLGVDSDISIQDEDGNEVITFKLSKTYQNILISSPKIEENTKYIVYTEGTVSNSEEFHGLYIEETNYEGGTQNTTFTTETMVTNLGGKDLMMKDMKPNDAMGGMNQPDDLPPDIKNEDFFNENFSGNKPDKPKKDF